MIKKLNTPPTSGQYEEIFFDLAGVWKGANWHYVLFTTTDGQEWCGHFREGDLNNFLSAELTNKNICCIVSGGHGYIIDIDKKKIIFDIKFDQITSIASDSFSSSFIVATYYGMKLVDSNFNEIEIILPMEVDGVNFLDSKDKKLFLDLGEIGADMERNTDYYLDLNDWTIKKHCP